MGRIGPSRPPSSVVDVVVDGSGVVVVGRGGLDVLVGRVVVVVDDGVVLVVVVVVVGRDDVVRDVRLGLEWVTGAGATGGLVAVVVWAGAAACWPWKSVVTGGGILISAMPSTTPAIADTTSAVLALITRSNGVLAARLTSAPSH